MAEMSPFSEDYSTARERFRHAAKSLGSRVDAYPIVVDQSTGLDLSIDIAVVGTERPSRIILVTSGLHGVEGFFGLAVQVALLEGSTLRNKLPPGTSVVLVHGLNPFGFAALRRVDAANVDLNRNFLLTGEEFTGCPLGYAELDWLLNPQRPPARFDHFWPQILTVIFRQGLRSLKQVVAGGQYEFPRGLFFGGKIPSPKSDMLRTILVPRPSCIERLPGVRSHQGQDCLPAGRDLRDEQAIHRHLDPG